MGTIISPRRPPPEHQLELIETGTGDPLRWSTTRAASTSVTAVAIRELDAATRRVDNAALVATLPDLDIPAAKIVEQLEADRR